MASRNQRAASPVTSRSGSSHRVVRSTPSACPSSTSASRRGESTRAACSATSAESSASRTPGPANGDGMPRDPRPALGRVGLEAAALLVVLQGGGELVEVALQDGVEVVGRELDAVVSDAPLAVVVGPDLLGAVARPDLGAARVGGGRLLLGQRALVEPGAQDAHRLLTVLQLALLVLHGDRDAGRLVRDPDRGVGRVDRLAARAAGAVDVDL